MERTVMKSLLLLGSIFLATTVHAEISVSAKASDTVEVKIMGSEPECLSKLAEVKATLNKAHRLIISASENCVLTYSQTNERSTFYLATIRVLK